MEKLETEQVHNIWLKVVSQKHIFTLTAANQIIHTCTNAYILSAKAKTTIATFFLSAEERTIQKDTQLRPTRASLNRLMTAVVRGDSVGTLEQEPWRKWWVWRVQLKSHRGVISFQPVVLFQEDEKTS